MVAGCAFLLLGGCDDKKAADTKPIASAAPSAVPSAVAPPSASAPAPVASAPSKTFAEKFKCDALLPEAQRSAAGLLNYKLSQTNTCKECGPTCSLVQPDKPFEGVSVSYVCNAPYDKAAADKEVDEQKKALKKPAPITLGRGGVMGEKESGLFYAAVVFDDDSDCKISVDWMRGDKKKIEPLVKMAVQGIKQADVVAAKK
jgi:hypothetical protein